MVSVLYIFYFFEPEPPVEKHGNSKHQKQKKESNNLVSMVSSLPGEHSITDLNTTEVF